MRYGLTRRDWLRLAALPALPRAAVSAPEKTPERTIVFVPQAMPASLDPIATPSFATRTASAAVFETLFGTDARLNPMPQMVEQFEMKDDGRSWVFQLRPGLLFHDGAKVTARDCIASLRRWMRRDRAGRVLGAHLDFMEAADDQTITFRLGKPLAQVPLLLTKSELSMPVIMPEQFANSSTDIPVSRIIGSGPFRLPNLSWRPGDDLDLVRFEQYQPRLDASSFTGGTRTVHVDRVSWRMKDDAVQALRDGTVDWVEWLPPDPGAGELNDPGVVAQRLDGIGYYAMLRLNTTRGLTANPRIRRVILAGVDPGAVMETVFGANSDSFVSPIGLFAPGSDFANTAGSDRIGGKQSPRAVKSMLKDAGYNGEPFVLVNPVDDMIHTRLAASMADELTQIGVTVEQRNLDRAAFEAWRRQANSIADPGWSGLCDSVPCADHYDGFAISAGPAPPGGLWPGWTDDAPAERLRQALIDAPDLKAKRAVAAKLQEQVFTTAGFVPLGQWFPTTGWRTTLTGPQKGPFPVFWEIARV